jgi:hypothetical protein
MGKLSATVGGRFDGRAACLAALSSLLCLAGCGTVESTPEHAAILYYQHVANAHEIRFSSPVALPHRFFPIDFVTALDREGFWAIFLVCGLDTRPSVLPGFRYDIRNFRVRYGRQRYGPLQPYTLRLEGSAELNTPIDARMINDAIGAEIHEGPASAVFGRGLYPGLNYRFAVYVPRALPNYAGEQLSLTYAGQPAVLVGNGRPPYDIPAVGGSGAGISAACVPRD